MANGVLYRSSLEAGIFTSNASKSTTFGKDNSQKPLSRSEVYKGLPSGSTCNACSRKGHAANKCNFVRAKHPDANYDFKITWADSDKGKAWAKKGKTQCPGITTLKGDAFAFPNFNEKGK